MCADGVATVIVLAGFALAALPVTIKSLPEVDDDDRSLATSTDSGFKVGAVSSFTFLDGFVGVACFSAFGGCADLSTSLPPIVVALAALSDVNPVDGVATDAFC